ncbi:MAG TPA: alanine--tRNA ligase [bacterium]|nr:alanine--tRNA ligase [bacterium]
MMTGHEIRTAYERFFVERGHIAMPSDSLVPKTDPTLLFTSAGMVQFKPYFLGQKGDELRRACSCQKCLRTSDLENVGHTARHHTFFEMLGNFSFGDYFKQDAIVWAWQFMTEVLKLDKAKLWITIFENDDEAEKLWQSEAGVAADRIIRMGEDSNFWKMGDTGPCGPCSEIHIDQGEEIGCGRPDCNVECDCDRFLELWNLVFTQFDRQADGTLEPLPRKNIDTGMGLERIAAVMQNGRSNYDSDLFQPMFDRIQDLSGVRFGESRRTDIAMRILADHARAVLFALTDGITPSNTGRGYVIKRILRRALRQGRILGLKFPFFASVMDSVVSVMRPAFSELTSTNINAANRIVEMEEESFGSILERGGELLYSRMDELRAKGESVLSGREAFKLYDTYGFPFEQTLEILDEEGFSCSREDFEAKMKQQRERARQAWKGTGATDRMALDAAGDLQATEFVGYTDECCEANILAIWDRHKRCTEASQGQKCEIVLDRTPFYAESGGQVGDGGTLSAKGVRFVVQDTQKTAAGIVVHLGEVAEGTLLVNQDVMAEIDHDKRGRIRRNHTSTHLLHAALRHVVGSEAKQSGSKVDESGFRFDFACPRSLSKSELTDIEQMVNGWICGNHPVQTRVVSLQDALAQGAMALFDEKYEDKVRLLEIADISKELCGGTHASRTGDIGSFRIVSEGSVSAGVRRLEALTGLSAWAHAQSREAVLDDLCELLKSPCSDLSERVRQIQEQTRNLEKQLEKELAQRAVSSAAELINQGEAIMVGDREVFLIRREIAGCTADQLNQMLDILRDKAPEGVYVLGTQVDGKAVLVCGVSPSLTKVFPAGKIIKAAAAITGGGGGGRPDRAQAGGKDGDKVPDALSKIPEILAEVQSH